MVKPVWKFPVDVFVHRVLVEIEDAHAASAIDAESIAEALNARGLSPPGQVVRTAATINKLLSSLRATDIISTIKNR